MTVLKLDHQFHQYPVVLFWTHHPESRPTTFVTQKLPFGTGVFFFLGNFHVSPIDFFPSPCWGRKFWAPRTSSPGVHRIWAKSSWKAADNHLQQKRCANGKMFSTSFCVGNHGMRRAKIWSIYEWIGWILLTNMPNVLLVSLHDDASGHGPSMILWMWDFFELDMYRNCIGPPCGTTRLHMKTPTCFSKYVYTWMIHIKQWGWHINTYTIIHM